MRFNRVFNIINKRTDAVKQEDLTLRLFTTVSFLIAEIKHLKCHNKSHDLKNVPCAKMFNSFIDNMRFMNFLSYTCIIKR